MKPNDLHRRRVMAALCVVPLLTTSCYSAGSDNWKAVANGVNGDAGPVEIRSLLIVSTEAGKPGRLLGTLVNDSEEEVNVVISDSDDTISVSLPAKGSYPFDTQPATLDTVADIPGSLVSVSVEAGTAQADLEVPVMDGSLKEYRPYLPGN